MASHVFGTCTLAVGATQSSVIDTAEHSVVGLAVVGTEITGATLTLQVSPTGAAPWFNVTDNAGTAYTFTHGGLTSLLLPTSAGSWSSLGGFLRVVSSAAQVATPANILVFMREMAP